MNKVIYKFSRKIIIPPLNTPKKKVRGNATCEVEIYDKDGTTLLNKETLSSSFYDWGYKGSAPTALAIVVLKHYLGDSFQERIPKEVYLPFRNEFISSQTKDEWQLTDEEIKKWLEKLLETW